MEVALGVFSLLSSGAAAGTAAAGTVAAAGAGAATWAGIGSTALSVIQGVATAGGILSSLAGGMASNSESKLQASATELQSREEALRIRTDEVQKIGAARVAFAGSGVSLAAADPIEDALAGQSDFESGLALSSGAVKAGQIRLGGKGKMIGAVGDISSSVANYGLSVAKRG